MILSLARAYLLQSVADYESYKLLELSGQPVSQQLHFLQMAFEKAGKAYLAAYGNELSQLRKSHFAFGRFVRLIARHSILQDEGKMNSRQVKSYITKIQPLVDKIERLAPALSNGLNAEYPWVTPDDELMTPCQHEFKEIMLNLESVQGRNLMKLLEKIIFSNRWHTEFGIR